MDSLELLEAIRFGNRVAEHERKDLVNYFVETYQWRRLLRGEVDIIYGAKGSGKSAIYLLMDTVREMFEEEDRTIILPAENYTGTPAFQVLDAQSLRKEGETFLNDDLEAKLRFIWKLYFASLIAEDLKSRGIRNDDIDQVIQYVEEAQLIPKEKSLKNMLRSVVGFFRKNHLKDASLEVPGFSAKISFLEPDAEQLMKGVKTPQDLLESLEKGLEAMDWTVWVTLDRLDVAFASSEDRALERSALRSLFRVYLDFAGLERIRLKIFLRSDIWKKLMSTSFREASHITRHTTLKWDRTNLLSLIIKRLVSNEVVVEVLGNGESKKNILADPVQQEALFYRIFPAKVDRQKTLNWVFSRIEDGNGVVTPRELIHLLEEAKVQQLLMEETGHGNGKKRSLISQQALKAAFEEVSKARFRYTLLAETDILQNRIVEFKEGKAEHCLDSLLEIWTDMDAEDIIGTAEELVEIGFFHKRKSGEQIRYWIPHLYRPALELVQGTDCK